MTWTLIAVKWSAQILATLAALWALRSARPEGAPARGARITAAALAVGFMAFAMSDITERAEGVERAKRAEVEAEEQSLLVEQGKEEIETLQRLVRAGQPVMGLEVSWELPEPLKFRLRSEVVTELVDEVLRARSGGPPPDDRFVNAQELYLRRVDGAWSVGGVWHDRDGGTTKLGPFIQGTAEYQILETVLTRLVLGGGFRIQTDDKVLVDLPDADWPVEVRIYSGVATFVLRRPNVSLLDLEEAEVSFGLKAEHEEYPLAKGWMRPREVLLRSLDSRFELDQKFALEWSERAVRERAVHTHEFERTTETEHELVSGPHALRGGLRLAEEE